MGSPAGRISEQPTTNRISRVFSSLSVSNWREEEKKLNLNSGFESGMTWRDGSRGLDLRSGI